MKNKKKFLKRFKIPESWGLKEDWEFLIGIAKNLSALARGFVVYIKNLFFDTIKGIGDIFLGCLGLALIGGVVFVIFLIIAALYKYVFGS